MKFKIGDRVEWLGSYTNKGTVINVELSDVIVKWDHMIGTSIYFTTQKYFRVINEHNKILKDML